MINVDSNVQQNTEYLNKQKRRNKQTRFHPSLKNAVIGKVKCQKVVSVISKMDNPSYFYINQFTFETYVITI